MADRDQTEPEGTGPTARRIILGAQLRRLRERAGVARSDAAWSIRGSDSKMSRLEAGKVGFKERDVADLLTLYGITDDAERELLLDTTRRSNEPGWWQPYGDVLPDWFEDYARAIITSGHPDRATPDDERRLAVRMRRQQTLGRRDAPTVWAILDESVLHRPIGGPSALVAQVEHLLELSSLPNVVVQVLPFGLSGYAAESTFSILRFSEPELPDLVYQEHLTAAVYLDKRADVESYSRVMDRVAVDALTPDETRQHLSKIVAEG